MLHATTRVTGPILWANLHLLFWLSLFPFATGWMGQNHFGLPPTALYGFVLLMAGIAYFILQHAIIASQGPRSEEHTSELQSHLNLVCRLLLEKKTIRHCSRSTSTASFQTL